MIRKLINTLLHGDSKTKGFLWSVLFVSISAAGLVAASFITGYFPLLIPAAVMGIADAFLMDKFKLSAVTGKDVKQDSGLNGRQDSDRTAESRYGETREEEKSGYMQRYSESELKKYFRKFKVKKEHYPILIDRSEKLGVSECPAYIWKDRKGIHLFLLEEEPRKADIRPASFTEVTCRKNVPANSSIEYKEIQSAAFVRLVFGKLLPEYIRDGYAGHFTEKKNLYGFSDDIFVTAASARVLLESFGLPFNPEGADRLFKNRSKYYTEAKKLMMLWQDGIYSGGEYKTKIKVILNMLCMADLSYFEFSDELDEMVRSRLITDEYAEHFRDVRDSLKKKSAKK